MDCKQNPFSYFSVPIDKGVNLEYNIKDKSGGIYRDKTRLS